MNLYSRRGALLCTLMLFLNFTPDFNSSAAQRPKKNAAAKKNAESTIQGIITDNHTGVPISDVFVSSEYMGDSSDTKGKFTVPLQKPGLHEIVASRRDYVTAHLWVKVRSDRRSKLNIKMERARPAICKLAGSWSVEFTLVTPSHFGPRPTRKRTAGTLYFSSEFSSPFPWKPPPVQPADPVLDEFGASDINFSPFWGSQVQSGGSTSLVGGKPGQPLLTEVTGYVCAEDHVRITLIPRMSHGGVALSGRVYGDKITGDWSLRAYSGGATGRFTMRRMRGKDW